MIARGSVDDHGSGLAVAVDLPHAVSVPFQTPSDLGGSECHVQPIAFDLVHRNAMSACCWLTVQLLRSIRSWMVELQEWIRRIRLAATQSSSLATTCHCLSGYSANSGGERGPARKPLSRRSRSASGSAGLVKLEWSVAFGRTLCIAVKRSTPTILRSTNAVFVADCSSNPNRPRRTSSQGGLEMLNQISRFVETTAVVHEPPLAPLSTGGE